MSIQSLIIFGITVSIFLTVLTVGMRVEPGDLRYVLSRPARLVRCLLAMVVLAPIVTILVCRTFSLHPAVIVALVTLSVAPVAPLFPKAMLSLVGPGHFPFARGVFFASTVLAVILTPLAVGVIRLIFGGHVRISPLAVSQVVISSVLLPLGVGLAVGRLRPASKHWIPVLEKVSGFLLLACAVVLVIGTWSLMASVVWQGTLMAIVLITLIGLAVGHLLGGPDEDGRTVLAVATVTRHPGVALAVAALTDQPLAPIGVLVAVVVGALAVLPYKQWRKRRAAAGAAGRGPPLAGAH